MGDPLLHSYRQFYQRRKKIGSWPVKTPNGWCHVFSEQLFVNFLSQFTKSDRSYIKS